MGVPITKQIPQGICFVIRGDNGARTRKGATVKRAGPVGWQAGSGPSRLKEEAQDGGLAKQDCEASVCGCGICYMWNLPLQAVRKRIFILENGVLTVLSLNCIIRSD